MSAQSKPMQVRPEAALNGRSGLFERFSIYCLGVAALFFVLKNGKEVLIPLACMFFLFALLEPAVRWLQKKRIPRLFSAPVLAIGIALGLIGAGWGAYGGISTLLGQMPQYSQRIHKLAGLLDGKVKELERQTQGLMPTSAPELPKVDVAKPRYAWSSTVLAGLGSAVDVATAAAFVILLTAFLLLDWTYLSGRIERAFPAAHALPSILEEVSRLVRGYFMGNLAVGAMGSALFAGIFLLMHLEHPFELAIFAGLFNLIPIFGTIIGAILPCAQALLQYDHFQIIALILLSTLVLHFVMNNVLVPWVVGTSININATAVTFSLLFWGWIWGIPGLLLAVPLVGVLRILLNASESTRRLGALLTDEKSKGHRVYGGRISRKNPDSPRVSAGSRPRSPGTAVAIR